MNTYSLDFFHPNFFLADSATTSRNPKPETISTKSNRNETPPPPHISLLAFDFLASETTRRMVERTATPLSIHPEYADRSSINGKLKLTACQWNLRSRYDSIAHLRMVRIQGPKNDIINTWIFPRYPETMPVFAAELIAVGAETRVAFVDIQVPVSTGDISESVAILTSALYPRFAALQSAEKAPDWATHASLGNFVYGRNLPSTQFPLVQDCYLAYLDMYLEAFSPPAKDLRGVYLDRNENALEVLHAYQIHHMEHSPGNLFLNKLFGSEWTGAFMRDFLFAKPRG